VLPAIEETILYRGAIVLLLATLIAGIVCVY
jgi:hypothetical protein